ncbi:MAG: FAD-dependent oxidoreductase, partial [Nevskiaceae bacterium]
MPAFPLLRTTGPLRERVFDVLVVGGGIYGAWIAYDAALRGLNVALIERDDWAAGTSSASSKLIHGGLRYLEHYDFGLVRDALAERRRLHRLAPHLVRPLGFVMPVWKGPRASMFMLSAGLTLYDWLGGRGQP